ncbi:MAG: 2-oxoglutarate dehydrogenase E1 component, partial [Bacteroidia bacterium]
NSLLSEYAVLGFEYGYSLSSPNTLTIWEAQFGDFSNGAQVAIDQYIVSGESKWQKMTGLTLFLPHGYEGQGPEHSNARLERFLQLAAEYNMIIANCTTPANFFHLLRRQLAWPFRKPLVVFTPKSLLRHERVVSPVKDFTHGRFMEVIDDADAPKTAKRVLLCSGKVYYDLLARKEEKKIKNIAIVRIEQPYPWPETGLEKIYSKYSKAEFVWVQEEPKNLGPWYFINSLELPVKLKCISRKKSASPATGYNKVHQREQNEIVSQAMTIE